MKTFNNLKDIFLLDFSKNFGIIILMFKGFKKEELIGYKCFVWRKKKFIISIKGI